MRQHLAILILALISHLSVSGQLLWRVTPPGDSAPSYILGTHHLAPAWLPDSIRGLDDIFGSVRIVYGELDMEQSTSPEFQMIMMQAMSAPADSTLSVILTPAQADSLNTMLGAISGGQMSIQMVEGLKPNAVASFIGVALTANAVNGYDPTFQLDGAMQTRARQAGIAVEGLETVQQQCEILFNGSLSEQVEDLMELVRDPEAATRQAVELSEAYTAGDLDRVYALATDSIHGMDKLDAMLNDRNKAWVKILTQVMPDTPALIVVGAGHLPGPEGVLQLLRLSGYAVEPVNPQGL